MGSISLSRQRFGFARKSLARQQFVAFCGANCFLCLGRMEMAPQQERAWQQAGRFNQLMTPGALCCQSGICFVALTCVVQEVGWDGIRERGFDRGEEGHCDRSHTPIQAPQCSLPGARTLEDRAKCFAVRGRLCRLSVDSRGDTVLQRAFSCSFDGG